MDDYKALAEKTWNTLSAMEQFALSYWFWRKDMRMKLAVAVVAFGIGFVIGISFR